MRGYFIIVWMFFQTCFLHAVGNECNSRTFSPVPAQGIETMYKLFWICIVYGAPIFFTVYSLIILAGMNVIQNVGTDIYDKYGKRR